MNISFLKTKTIVYVFILISTVTYVVIKAYQSGIDLDVCLYASNQLFNGENIYEGNPYNNYLYSPLHALLLRPISIFDYAIARVIWALINITLTIRLCMIISSLIKNSLELNNKFNIQLTIGAIFISLGFLNHNLILGQITIVILWLTFEGLYQIINQNKPVIGALLLALGISIKIIPLLGLFYLFFKRRYKVIIICICFVIAGLFFPSVIIKHSYNMKMLNNWKETIKPTRNKYVFENNLGTQSLNAILPTYFYNFNDAVKVPSNPGRLIISIPHDTLVIIMQMMRVLLAFSILLLIFYRYNQRKAEPLYFYWEFSYLALVSALIFPHQQKYVMLYFVPAGSYMILFILFIFRLKWKVSFKYKIIAILAAFLMFVSAIMGRDIVGDQMVYIFDYYRVFGLINLIFLVFLILIRPNLLIELNNKMLGDTNELIATANK